ncbi:HNH endonuclease [Nocardioides sp. ChNu-99]|nr:HNH endonuclease [Nocardioides sp. ChNu-99]
MMGESSRHPKEQRPCVVCGAVVVRRVDASYATTCSVRCRSVVQWGHRLAPSSGYDWAQDAVKRARAAGVAIVEVFDRAAVFARDEWTCQLCAIRCTDPDPYTLTAATVDHVVALADQGEHSRANAQTLCLSCNSSKQAGIAQKV